MDGAVRVETKHRTDALHVTLGTYTTRIKDLYQVRPGRSTYLVEAPRKTLVVSSWLRRVQIVRYASAPSPSITTNLAHVQAATSGRLYCNTVLLITHQPEPAPNFAISILQPGGRAG